MSTENTPAAEKSSKAGIGLKMSAISESGFRRFLKKYGILLIFLEYAPCFPSSLSTTGFRFF